MTDKQYGEHDIDVKEGLDGVRTSPGMYIGTTGIEGLKHMIREIVHNSIDEYTVGRASQVAIRIHNDNRTTTVSDNGGGIPVGIHAKTKVSGVETVLTNLHAGGKFEGNTGYKQSGGMHGVGTTVVNALSEFLEVEVKREGKIWRQSYKRGIPDAPLAAVGRTTETGTSITFRPDYTVMQDIEYDPNELASEFEDLAYLNAGLSIKFIQGENEERIFTSKNGVASIADKYSIADKVMANPIVIQGNDEERGITVEVAFNYVASSEQVIMAYTNNVSNPEGGKHVDGFKSALTRAINRITGNSFKGDELRSGLVAVVSIKMLGRPELVGQTKGKLGSEAAQPAVDSIVYRALSESLSPNSKLVKFIVKRAEENRKTKDSLSMLKEIESEKNSQFASLFTKLVPATGRGKKDKELFIVEGESAGGTAIQARNEWGEKHQAILPARGKVLNTSRATASKVLKDGEVRSIVSAVGVGFSENENDIDLDKCDYERIIIMADGDADGLHIQVLLLTLFYRYMRALVRAGMVYVALPPLFKVTHRDGEQLKYCMDEAERDEAVAQFGHGAQVQRYKGLGEMDPDELWDTTMNPETRILLQIDLDNDDEEAIERMFHELMGNDADTRKAIIMEEGVWNAGA
ncbi:DNA topoisomerase 4 subunit B [compost metagenome]